MEAYSRWRDTATGIQPFLPPVPPRIDSGPWISVNYIIKPLLSCIRLTLLVITIMIYVVLYSVILLFAPISPLYRAGSRILSFLLGRLVLLLLGFIYIPTMTLGLTKGRNASTKIASTKSGDVIISNWSSYVDVLYLLFRYDPIFAIPNESGRLCVVSLLGALGACGSCPKGTETGIYTFTLEQVVNKAKKAGRPVVVFAEGTCSNNRCLLRFTPVLKDAREVDGKSISSTTVHVICMKYDYTVFSPTTPIPLSFMHIATLAGQYTNMLSVYTYAGHYQVSFKNGEGSTSSTVDLTQLIQETMGKIGRLRKAIGLGLPEKRAFLDYYSKRKK